MIWQCGGREVGEPISAVISATAAAGGANIHVDVTFRLVEWPWDERGPLSLIPQPCAILARTTKDTMVLGFALPEPNKVIISPKHSHIDRVRFSLTMTMLALDSLEASRNGGGLELIMPLVAHPIWAGGPVYPTSHEYELRVPKEDWTAALRAVGYCDVLLSELRLPLNGPESTAAGRRRLQSAVTARNDGSYAEAMRQSRVALDELKTAGFGGKAPAEVVKFVQDRAGTLSPLERFSVRQVALKLFASPAHHANAPDETYLREQADVAIALAAALLKLAPVLGLQQVEEPDASP